MHASILHCGAPPAQRGRLQGAVSAVNAQHTVCSDPARGQASLVYALDAHLVLDDAAQLGVQHRQRVRLRVHILLQELLQACGRKAACRCTAEWTAMCYSFSPP